MLMILVAWISVFNLTTVEAYETATLTETSLEIVDDWAACFWQQVIAVAMKIDAKSYPIWITTWNN